VRPFYGRLKLSGHTIKKVPWELWFAPLVLSGLGLVMGLILSWSKVSILVTTVKVVMGNHMKPEVFEWHGLSKEFIYGLLSFMGGVLLFLNRKFIRSWSIIVHDRLHLGPQYWYEWSLEVLNKIARFQTKILQHGYQRYYLLFIICIGMLFLVPNLFVIDFLNLFQWKTIFIYEQGLAFFLMAFLFVIVMSKTRIGAVILLGVLGTAITAVYFLYGAPDLALTHFLVEALVVVLFTLLVYRFPKFIHRTTLFSRVRDTVLSLMVGFTVTGLILMTQDKIYVPISKMFGEWSYLKAHGKNIVNVVIIDFRGLDTLGEITVLALAALGVYILLKWKKQGAAKR